MATQTQPTAARRPVCARSAATELWIPVRLATTGTETSLMPANRCVSATCGDGLVREDLEEDAEGYEFCDDGNQSNNDRCLDSCRVARCGDGFVREGVEGCDDANEVEADACTNACALARCGDGIQRLDIARARKAMRRPAMAYRTMTMRASRVASSPGAAMVLFKSVKKGVTMPTPTTVTPAFKGVRLLRRGFIRAGIEACDDANNSNTDACLTNCTAARCGDGHVRRVSGRVMATTTTAMDAQPTVCRTLACRMSGSRARWN